MEQNNWLVISTERDQPLIFHRHDLITITKNVYTQWILTKQTPTLLEFDMYNTKDYCLAEAYFYTRMINEHS